jgi:hypothetical protein
MSQDELARARAAALAARARFDDSLAEARERLRPASLVDAAWDEAKDRAARKAAETAAAIRARPGAVALAVGAVALFFARRPALRALSRVAGRDKPKRRSQE